MKFRNNMADASASILANICFKNSKLTIIHSRLDGITSQLVEILYKENYLMLSNIIYYLAD
jgi:hypothetical protein